MSQKTLQTQGLASCQPRAELNLALAMESASGGFHRVCSATPDSPKSLLSVCSILCSITIAILLKLWSGNPVPELPRGATPNAVVSVLATISKSTMLLVVGTCLAQTKWNWYRKAQPLTNIQLFDDASRGPLGALFLLMNRTVFSPAALGAAIMILALAFDPFVQQALVYPLEPHSVPNSAAQARRALAFNGPSDLNMSMAIRAAMWDPKFDLPLSCPTVNCTWDSFETIAICHKCQSTSPKVAVLWDYTVDEATFDNDTAFNVTYNFTVDGFGPFVQSIAVVYVHSEDYARDVLLVPVKAFSWLVDHANSQDQHNRSLIGLDNPQLVLGYSEVAWNGSTPTLQNTQFCALDYCVRQYNVSVMNGRAVIAHTGSTFGSKHWRSFQLSLDDPSRGYAIYDVLCWGKDSRHDLDLVDIDFKHPYSEDHFEFCNLKVDTEGNVTSDHDWNLAIENALIGKSTLDENVYLMEIDNINGSLHYVLPGVQKDRIMDSEPYRSRFDNNELDRMFLDLGFERTMQNLADSLTQLALSASQSNITGNNIFLISHIQVRWYWLILPALLSLLAALFLTIVIVETRISNTPLWKSSLVTVFFHGLDHEVPDRGDTKKVSQMDEQARAFIVQLRRTDITDKMVFGKAD